MSPFRQLIGCRVGLDARKSKKDLEVTAPAISLGEHSILKVREQAVEVFFYRRSMTIYCLKQDIYVYPADMVKEPRISFKASSRVLMAPFN
jgi:hypothetical protein